MNPNQNGEEITPAADETKGSSDYDVAADPAFPAGSLPEGETPADIETRKGMENMSIGPDDVGSFGSISGVSGPIPGAPPADPVASLSTRVTAAEGSVSSGLSQIDALEPATDPEETSIEANSPPPAIEMNITRGRVVYYTPGVDDRELYGQKALTAHIAEVYDQKYVNLAVLHPTGKWFQRTSVRFLQPADPVPDVSYATWMPFQVAQAGLR